MPGRRLLVPMLMAAALAAPGAAHAVTAWDEVPQGDLSNDGLAPTVLSFVTGANTVVGAMGDGDRDYFSFTVPAGALLSAIQVNAATVVSGASSFIAIQVGPRITVTPSGGGTGPASLLAFDHFDAADIGTNLLARLLPQSPGLAQGVYAVWLNETAGTAPYSFDFVLSAVPEPAHGLLLGAGLLALAMRVLGGEPGRLPRSRRG